MTRRTGRSSAREFRRGNSRVATLLVALVVVGCNLTSPTSPNEGRNLTGQNPNIGFTFSGSVSISLPSSVPADGISEGVVTVTVRDENGNPVANLTPVTISTTIGFLRVPGSDPTTGSSVVSVSTFNGIAQALISSVLGGNGTVLAAVGDVVSSGSIRFDVVPIRGSLSSFFRIAGEDLFNVFGTASINDPFTAGIVATAIDDETGLPLAGVLVRFRIVRDTTGFVAGVDRARLDGPETSFTDVLGEAFNQLRVQGTGVVVIEADLIDPNTNEVVGTSNQIIADTRATAIVTLTFSDGASTTFSTAAPYTEGLIALVTDVDGNPLPSRVVRFSITTDTTTAGATLAALTATTDTTGMATNAVTVPDPGGGTSTVSIIGELLDSAGSVQAASNTVNATGT